MISIIYVKLLEEHHSFQNDSRKWNNLLRLQFIFRISAEIAANYHVYQYFSVK
jgi:hypothetical protein